MKSGISMIEQSARANRISLALSVVLLFLVAQSSPLAAQLLGAIPALPPVVVTQTSDGLTATIGDETLRISVCNASVVHVIATPKAPASIKDDPWILDPKQSCPGAKFQFAQTDEAAVLTTANLKVELSLKRGNLKYSSIGGELLLRESDAIPRTYEPAQVNGESVYHVADRFSPDVTEGFYGLGQHQSGMFNYRGSTVELGQNNTDVALPLLVSSKGYALLWNTASFTYADNRFPLAFEFSSLAADSVDYYLIYGPE
ncbi:MAG: hypothetical protein WB755_28335, partial [Terriglobales bacterium]